MPNKSFEDNLFELKETVKALEKSDISLDEAIALFQKGMEISKKCSDKLSEAQLKIATLADEEQINAV